MELHDKYLEIADKLPKHVYRDAAKGKQSFEIEFENIFDRDEARTVLADANIRFRTGKALVPFRISGNVEWGVPVPEIEGVDGLTVWCWPESLWAPLPSPWRATMIAVFRARHGALSGAKRRNGCISSLVRTTCISMVLPSLHCSPPFRKKQPVVADAPEGELQQTKLIANHHILFGDKKASSSGSVKPPTADELLEHYTSEQLRAHFLALALDQKSVGFKPKIFDPDPESAKIRVLPTLL